MPRKSRLWSAVLALCILGATTVAQESERAWIRIHHSNLPVLEKSLIQAGYDVFRQGRQTRESLDAIVTLAELEALYRTGARIEVLVGFGMDAPPDANYKTDVEVMQILQTHAKNYPGITRFVDLNADLNLPKTAENRSVYALKISDNPQKDEDEEAILIYANEHCRELVAIEVALYAIDQLLKGYNADPQIKSWIDSKEIWFIPNNNPDGLAYVWSTDNMWRKNRRHISGSYYGVDLNRNFDMGWHSSCAGSTRASSSTYKGPSPFSEIEDQVIRDLHKREHFAKVLSNHNSGQEVLFPLVCSVGGIPAVLNTYLKGLDSTLASAMSYRTRNASAEGEGYQWVFKWNGAFSTLIEDATAFQPSWSSVDPEVKRVFPGFKWLINLKIPLSGHVTSKYTGGPVRADIAVQGYTYGNGETRFSEAKYGRYHYFMPDGSYNLTFTADGYKPRVVNNVSVSQSGTVLDVQMEPSAYITISGTPKIGNTLTLALNDPGVANEVYVMRAALTTSPPIDLGYGDFIPLGPDFLFFISPFLPGIFKDFTGTLDASGKATASVVIPAETGLAGLTVYQAFVSIDTTQPNAIGHVSAPAGFKITP